MIWSQNWFWLSPLVFCILSCFISNIDVHHDFLFCCNLIIIHLYIKNYPAVPTNSSTLTSSWPPHTASSVWLCPPGGRNLGSHTSGKQEKNWWAGSSHYIIRHVFLQIISRGGDVVAGSGPLTSPMMSVWQAVSQNCCRPQGSPAAPEPLVTSPAESPIDRLLWKFTVSLARLCTSRKRKVRSAESCNQVVSNSKESLHGLYIKDHFRAVSSHCKCRFTSAKMRFD